MLKNRPQSNPDGDAEPESELPTDGLVRLNKFMAELGVASRRKCDEMIVAGKVSVDGQPAVELGTKIDPTRQSVDVNGVILKPLGVRRRYYLLNKPRGVVCTNEPREARMRAIDLITDRNKGRIFSVGRLDEDSSGLLLLTNDTDWAERVASPTQHVPKTYRAQVAPRLDEAALVRLRAGVVLEDGPTRPALVERIRDAGATTILELTISEGRNRQVRRMLREVGSRVRSLKRVRVGELPLGSLPSGTWRRLTPQEVELFPARSRHTH